MRLGILIIGSLYWDRSRVRCRWRQNRLGCIGERRVRVPIRYGKKSDKRGGTFTMVFSRSCAEVERLGTAIVVPARVECCEPEHLRDEAEQLWAAERDRDDVGPICAEWGRVCILPNPAAAVPESILGGWRAKISEAGSSYAALPTAEGEEPVLDPNKGHALLDWPMDSGTGQPLSGFDLLLMTATRPTIRSGQYPTPEGIAEAWRADEHENVLYFYNNRHFGITTFEDEQIRALLQGAGRGQD